MKPRILLIEDNVEFSRMVKGYLEGQGFHVDVESRGEGALRRIVDEAPSMVILDVMLPGADGLSICRGARSRYGGPILLLTALGEEQDEVIGLEAGADDYVVKPVRPRALIARIRNLLARAEGRPRAGERIVIGELVIDAGTRSAYRAGRAIALSSAEFDLLWMLARAAGAIVSREEIYRSLRGIEYDGLDRSMDVRIVRLRRKLGDDSKAPTLIKNVRGEGYLLSRQP